MRADSVPASLYIHPAWLAWKGSQGWTPTDSGLGFPLLLRPLGGGASMAYCASPFSLPCLREGPARERGAALERLSQRVLPRLPRDCAFIRWDLMLEAWADDSGAPLDARLQEMRMNAPTEWRCLRKAPAETTCTSTMVVELDGPEAMRARMDNRTRYSLRLAERRGTLVRRAGEEGLEAFQRLHAETAARHGLKEHPASSFRRLFSAARAHGLALDLYLAEGCGGTAAAAIVARHREESWYLFAASSRERRASAGPSAILYRAMLDGAASGARRIDLLGAAPHGEADHPLARLSVFKAGFGGRRMSRAGAWDFVLRPHLYASYAKEEALRQARDAVLGRPAPQASRRIAEDGASGGS